MKPFTVKGKCSWFGGPDDTGMDADEPLAFIYSESDTKGDIFLSYHPDDPATGEPTTGLGRKLNPEADYVACRFYPEGNAEAKEAMRPLLLTEMALVTAENGKSIKCWCADWGPHQGTNRVADLSPAVLEQLEITTDDVVTVQFPFTHRAHEPIKPYESIVISSGHGLKVRGASGVIDEVDEARRVVNAVAEKLRAREVSVKTFHDDVSTSQSENLTRIVNYHNAQKRQLDVSVHFNAYVEKTGPVGTECLWVTQEELAAQVAKAIADCGFINRGAKERTDLKFLNQTTGPSILVEVCFVDSEADASLYLDDFEEVTEAIATVLGGQERRIVAT